MHFMNENEFLLLMSFNEEEIYNPSHVLTIEERIKLRETGIQTAIEYPRWYAIEPSKGNYNFYTIENILYKNREAGTKTIFPIYGSNMPKWMPDDWFAKQENGIVRREALSMWNRETTQYLEDYYKMLIGKFSAPDVMFIFAEYMEGEAVLPCEPSFYDPCALEEYKKIYGSSAVPNIENVDTKFWLADMAVNYFIRMQRLFYEQYNEIWNMQQWLMNQWSRATINYAQPQILSTYKDTFPDVNIVLLQYTYYDTSHPQENEDYILYLQELCNCDVIVEAHYCAGLKETTSKSIAKGFRGQIICPTHIQSGEKELQDWMLNEIRKSMELWRTARG